MTEVAIAPTLNVSFLERIAALADPRDRVGARRSLATALGADELLVFLRDPDVNVFVPAPGFPQSLPDGKAWRAFLAECVADGESRATLPLRSAEEIPRATHGYASRDDAVLVLAGVGDPGADLSSLRVLMPLIAAALRSEQVTIHASVQARISVEAAARAADLARALEAARRELDDSLYSARQARTELQQAHSALEEARAAAVATTRNTSDSGSTETPPPA
jgi:hypothetical protein